MSRVDKLPDNTCAFFFFNDTATTEIYTLSLHDALPILGSDRHAGAHARRSLGSAGIGFERDDRPHPADRKSTRLNSSHGYISYAVFCLKKKKQLTCAATLLRRLFAHRRGLTPLRADRPI